MVQFVKGGPDIPEGLLHTHEQGRVIFFCGAGVSRQAGLPGFGELVEQCYEELCTDRTPEQSKAIESWQYDKAIRLLEGQLGPNYLDVRRTITQKLHEHRDERHGLDTHRALLRLARPQEHTRLMTTNFDHLFEKAAEKDGTKIDFYGPSITLLDDVSTWNGVVYLHGRMPKRSTADRDKSSGHDLAQLVLSSSNFAQAYQTGGQVTQFIQRLLFLRYTICFVGYSLEDTMFQYLLDGNCILPNHSAYQDPFPPMLCAFVGAEDATDTSWEKWQERGIWLMGYRCKKPKNKPEEHTLLHNTLRAWAHSMDVPNKVKIIEDSACKEPSDSTPEDNFAGRVWWALKDKSAKPAERLVSLTPAPSLEWLVTSRSVVDANGVRSQIPASLFDGLNMRDHKDVITQLSYWLARHLNDPRVIMWLVGQPHGLRKEIIWYMQRHLYSKDDSGKPPVAMKPTARCYWYLFLGGHILSELPNDTETDVWLNIGAGLHGDVEFLDWQTSLIKNGLTAASKMYLVHSLRPMLVLKPKPAPNPWEAPPPKSNTKSRAMSFDDIACEMSCATNYEIGAHHHLQHPMPLIAEKNWHGIWQKALPEFFPDFNGLLRNGLDLLRTAGGADNERDGSYVVRDSISDWAQTKNKSHPYPPKVLDWYITLTRDAWLAKNKQHPEQSKADAAQWMQEPYPVFKRLAFFAATQSAFIEPRQALEWLLADGRIWLWSGETRREAVRLIVYLASRLDTADRGVLEQAILAKPPQLNHWDIGDLDVYLRLARLEKYLPEGVRLGDDAQARLKALREQNPKWKHDPEEDAEFPHKPPVQGLDTFKDKRTYPDIKPNRRSWVRWIKKHPSINFQKTEDGWAKFCDTHFPTAVCVLYALAKDGLWPDMRWHHALYTWASSQDSKRIHRSWRRISPLLEMVSDEVLSSLDASFGAWILKATEQDAIPPDDEALLIQLSKRLITLPDARLDEVMYLDTESLPEYVNQCKDSRVGRISEALLIYWQNKQLKDNASLPMVLKDIFTQMCDVQHRSLMYARVTLACYVSPLFDADPKWTKNHLLPLFDWNQDAEFFEGVCAMWQGYLTADVPDSSLLEAIKPYFLTTAKYDAVLGRNTAERYYEHLITIAIRTKPVFEDTECRQAIASLSPRGRAAIVSKLAESLRESTDKGKVKKWDDKIAPFFELVWPRDARYHGPAIAEQMHRCCHYAGARSEQARELLAPYIQPYIQ